MAWYISTAFKEKRLKELPKCVKEKGRQLPRPVDLRLGIMYRIKSALIYWRDDDKDD
jgi:hypothetical protein